MNTIEIISASAGSGKTYTLATLLETAVASGKVRPEAVLATTFTNKAAAELQERVRVRLLEAGRVPEAQRLTAARIGTVNSICGRLVSDFAFDLGLSPQLQVLDEESAGSALRKSLASVLTMEEEYELASLSERMVDFDWQKAVRRIVDLAQSNGIAAKKLADCAHQSKISFLELLGKPMNNAEVLNSALKSALEGFVKAVRAGEDTTQATKKALDLAENALHRLGSGFDLAWKEWVGLAKLAPGATSRDAAGAVCSAAAMQDQHPKLHQDVSRAIELVFSVAAQAIDAYQAYKRELGAIDFVDQEGLALYLLGLKSVQDQLKEELDLVLVDEFQDTSPIQLAIFLRLANLAPRSVWVGDQKQAIFGFRGTDPALMDAALEAVLGTGDPETLPKSYRSRPELVAFTSDLFAPAFDLQGIPAKRVRLEAAMLSEPEGLGPILECWSLQTRNKPDDVAALAAAVKACLKDKTVQVRDTRTNEVRPVRPGDIAILCRANDTCIAVAGQLASLGIKAVLPRNGLMGTLEARAVLAGLRRWVDPSDALAVAELARLIAFPDKPNEWLHALMDKPGKEAFAEMPEIQALDRTRQSQPKLGALSVFDVVVDSIGASQMCLRWGDATGRLANLEALRGHAVVYAQSAADQGAGCTPAGLVAYLLEMVVNEADSQGVQADSQAVVISTWHSAKGLEWPITVLFELTPHNSETAALGVSAVNDRKKIDLNDPLAERWVRYWLNPYDARQNKMPFHDRLHEHQATQMAMERAEREELRLLYVGWTRARDRVVLAGRSGQLTKGTLQFLKGSKGALVDEPSGNELSWAGRTIRAICREVAPIGSVEAKPEAAAGYCAAGAKDFSPAFVQPSSSEYAGEVAAAFERIHPRIPLTGDPDWSCLGNAFHAFFCADRPGLTPQQRLELANEITGRWGVRSAVSPEQLPEASNSLRAWIEGKWPKAIWHRECPIQHRLPSGSVVRGNADLVLEISEGFVVIDHKSFPGTTEEALKKAAGFAGQIHGYCGAIMAATKRPIIASYIHLPVLGLMVPISREGS